MSVKVAPIHQSQVYRQTKIWQAIFEKGHSKNIPVKLFQKLNIPAKFGPNWASGLGGEDV